MTSLSFSLSCIGEVNGHPLQCSCLENPRDGGAWWASVYGVAQSRTRLKRLSSSSSSVCVLIRDPFSLLHDAADLMINTDISLWLKHDNLPIFHYIRKLCPLWKNSVICLPQVVKKKKKKGSPVSFAK